MASGSPIEKCLEEYQNLWSDIIRRDAAERQRAGRPQVTQASIASNLHVDQAVVSRFISGKNLPRSMKLLIDIAQAYQATEAETRVLLAWASALAAQKRGEDEVAAHFLNMFDSLYPQQLFEARLIRKKDIVYNVLVDIGLDPAEAMEIRKRISEAHPIEQTVGQLLLDVDERTKEFFSGAGYDRIASLVKAHCRIPSIHFQDGLLRPCHVPSIRAAERMGAVQSWFWHRIPHVVVTKFKIDSEQCVRDTPHDGVEFLFLEQGSGDFCIGEKAVISLRQGERQLIAYRPNLAHSFTARSNGAIIYVVSYGKPQKKSRPTNDLVRSAARLRPL